MIQTGLHMLELTKNYNISAELVKQYFITIYRLRIINNHVSNKAKYMDNAML